MNSNKSLIYFSVIFFITALIFSCYKRDSFEKIKTEGRLVLEDTILKKGVQEPKGSIDVLLSNSTNFSDFIFKTTTNSDGSFSFSYKPVGDQPLYVLAKTTKDSVAYAVIMKVSDFTNGSDLVMLPKPGNGIKITAKDPSGNPLPNVSICLFSGPLALGTDDCSLALQSKATNETGVAVFNNIPVRPEAYHILAKATIGINEIRYTGNVSISSPGFSTKDILLTTQNGFTLTIKDSLGTPLNQAETYVYRSRAIFLFDTTNTNNILTLSTNNAGKTRLFNIDATKYYLRMQKKIGNIIFKRMDSIVVNVTGITDSTFILQQ